MDTLTQESQQEFFPDFAKPGERTVEARLSGPANRTQKPILLTTTLEQILFVAIVSILVMCGVYFLGILRGKSLAAETGPAAVSSDPMRVSAAKPTAPAVVSRPAVTVTASVAPRPAVSTVPIPTASTARPSLPADSQAVRIPGKAYTIQVVTHKRRAFAESELAAIGRAGFSGRIQESDGYYVVKVGQYSDKVDAKKDLAALKTKYSDCFLTHL